MIGHGKTLTIRNAPHIVANVSVDVIMRNVVLSLFPICVYAVYAFGLSSLCVLATAVASCVITETLLCRRSARETTIGDWSAVVTGLLYGLTLPPSLPLWMVAVGGVLAIGVGKFLFGGLGQNPFNPALVGRALLQAAFPLAMTTWPAMPGNRFVAVPTSTFTPPFCKPLYDGVSGATPLAQWNFEHITTSTTDLMLGSVQGSTGETSAFLILLGGLYLVVRQMMNWKIPFAILATVALSSSILQGLDASQYAGPSFMVLSGGLMLGAVFMATDPVASPMTSAGAIVYGVLIGLLIVLIRVWGGMPEGVMYSILICNAVAPHIDQWIQPRVFGTGRQVDR